MPGCAVRKYPNTDLNKQAEDMPEHLHCPSHQEDWMLIKGYPLHLQISSLHRAYIILLCKEMPSLEEEWYVDSLLHRFVLEQSTFSVQNSVLTCHSCGQSSKKPL